MTNEEQDLLYSDLPEPAEVVEPAPTSDQDDLWRTIEERIRTETLDEEEAVLDLPSRIQAYLASRELAGKIGAIGTQFSLGPSQTQTVASLVRRYLARLLPPETLEKELLRQGGVSSDIASEIAKALDPALHPEAEARRELVGRIIKTPGVAPELAGLLETQKQTEGGETPKSESSPEEESPVILHEESDAVEAAGKQGVRQSFRIEGGESVPQEPSKPEGSVRVRVEQPKPRIVHYNNLRTPLTPQE